jgi:hypothetical protein
MKVIITGIICLILSLSLLFFSFYIAPFLIWKLAYDVPDFISTFISFFEDKYGFTSEVSKFLVWLIFFAPGLIAGYISYFISHHIDRNMYGLYSNVEIQNSPSSSRETKEGLKESAHVGLKIIALMVVIVVIVLLLQMFVRLTA